MERLKRLFDTDEKLSNHLNSLWSTRAGLLKIIETRPDLEQTVLPQYKTINDIIGALISERPYHPTTGFYMEREQESDQY